MAEQKEDIPPAVGEEDEDTPGYKPPAPKSLGEIQNLDQADESLNKYKDTLLGQKTDALIEPNNPLNCIVKTLSMVTEGRPDVVLDLSGDISELKKKTITIKEGVQYRLKIQFYVQRDIVTGLKYVQHSYRKGIKVDNSNFMVGSYGPKPDMYEFLTPMEEAPSGMLYRGKYNVKSKFTDDDKRDYLSWEWSFEIKKDWE